MEYKYVIFTREEGVAIITMNRTERLNAMSVELMDEMRDALEVVKADPDTRVLILTGAGRAFCAGADVKQMGESVEAKQEGSAASLRTRAVF